MRSIFTLPPAKKSSYDATRITPPPIRMDAAEET